MRYNITKKNIHITSPPVIRPSTGGFSYYCRKLLTRSCLCARLFYDTKERINKMSKASKTYKTKEAGAPKLHTRVLSWFNYTALPFVAKAIVVSGFIYAIVDNLSKFHQLPANVQGAVSVVLSAIILKVAVNKKK